MRLKQKNIKKKKFSKKETEDFLKKYKIKRL